MEKIEELLRRSLKGGMREAALNRCNECPSDADLGLYAEGGLSGKRREELEAHIAACLYCQDMLVVANKAIGGRRQGLLRMPAGRKWLAGCLLCFALSFFIPRYFMQFLIAALILGIKWATEGAKSIVMVYKELQRSRNREGVRK